MKIQIPNQWKPRPYQLKLWNYMDSGGLRGYEVAHRRWGKDDVCLHWTAKAAFKRIGNYWHMLPIKEQARKAIWTAVNPHTGKKRIDEAFPIEIRKKTNDQEMFIEFINGSTWQVLGSDSYDSHVGAAPVGIVFSEWALADPHAWSYLEPILEENGGWVLFITTPRGRNHAATFYDMAVEMDDWFAEKQTVNDTGIFNETQLKRILKGSVKLYGIDDGKARFEQEYFCSFEAALMGSYWGSEMNKMENEGRICGVPYTPGSPVYPCFDFGIGATNSTSVTFIQIVGREPRVIDYEESNTTSIPQDGKMLKEKGYFYGPLILPHDAEPDRKATGTSYQNQFEDMGFSTVIVPVTPNKRTDIEIARQLIDSLWIDRKKGERLVDCMRSYHRERNEKTKVFSRTPKHDWASHGADSFQCLAVALKQGLLTPYITDYDDVDYVDGDFDEGSVISGY